MKISWRIITNCTTDAKTAKVVTAHFKSMGIETPHITSAPYHKGGFIVIACTEHLTESWPHFVIDALSLAQKSATGWFLTGEITEALDACSNSPRTSSISFINIYARPGA
jgi:hypothetical protein